ncbi:hypothetical protein [Paenibacillus sp. HW567]|uniref:hypothetical protein n=1 Tax=Paenibacillus sp. HW567 TaxID=1034769 RepID=UPI000373B39D|nr:hypothetical protein [Paenibacillus sp. HW567]
MEITLQAQQVPRTESSPDRKSLPVGRTEQLLIPLETIVLQVHGLQSRYGGIFPQNPPAGEAISASRSVSSVKEIPFGQIEALRSVKEQEAGYGESLSPLSPKAPF